MTIQWYPGQMAKARLYLKKMLKLIDLVVEVRDARIPESSQNPEIDKLVGNKPRLVILNKQDLADQELTTIWLASLRKKNVEAISISTLKGQGVGKVVSFVRKFGQEQRLKNRRGKPLRIMVVGIPNVGKSTFINKLSGRRAARTGNRPGITKGEQWVRVAEGIELLDTIGLLWPKFDSPEVAFKLAVTGAIKYELLDDYALAVKLLEYIMAKVPERLAERYKFTPGEDVREEDLLLDIGRSRGAIRPGGEVDPARAAEILLVDFRLGRLGEFTLDVPPLT